MGKDLPVMIIVDFFKRDESDSIFIQIKNILKEKFNLLINEVRFEEKEGRTYIFEGAVDKLNRTKDQNLIDWDENESKAFNDAFLGSGVYKLGE